MNVKGTLYIITAASGTGKTSLARELVNSLDNIRLSISYTTRQVRAGEQEGHDYFFVDVKTFRSLIQEQAFLEYAIVFDYYYGTSRFWVEEHLNQGIDIVLTIDWQGALQIRKNLNCTGIFLLPPSLAELQLRLEKRNRESTRIIADRLVLAGFEIAHCKDFDYIVINDNFNKALDDIKAVVLAKRLQKEKQLERYNDLIKELTKNTFK